MYILMYYICVCQSPHLLNAAGEMLNWPPYGKIAIPSVEIYCPVRRGGELLVVVEDSCLEEGRGRGGGDLGSFTGHSLVRLISLICRLSGLRLKAQRLKTRRNRVAKVANPTHSWTICGASDFFHVEKLHKGRASETRKRISGAKTEVSCLRRRKSNQVT